MSYVVFIYEQQELEDTSLITLDSSKSLIAGYLGKTIGDYLKQDQYLTITTNHSPRIVERVQSGKATVGLCAGLLPPHHGLMAFHLCDEPFSSLVINHCIRSRKSNHK